MNGRAISVGLACITLGCTGSAPRATPETASVRAPQPEAPAEPAQANEALHDTDPDARTIGPANDSTASASATADASDAAACQPRGPALAERVCDDARLRALLAELGTNDGQVTGFVRCQPLAVEDTEEVRPAIGKAGDTDLGSKFFGDLDIDGDRKPDVVRLFTSVDYWLWLVFVRERGCLRFVDAIDGYQVEPTKQKHHGMRDVRVLPYPLQSSVETRIYDGTRWVKR